MKTIEFDAHIFLDGTISLGPIDPEDFKLIGAGLTSMMRRIGQGNPVVETECLTDDQKKAMAERLAEMLIREVEG